jgi:hypothetical protein
VARAIIHTESGRTEVVHVSDFMDCLLTAFAAGDTATTAKLLRRQNAALKAQRKARQQRASADR